MAQHTQASCLAPYLKKMRTAKFFFIASSTTFALCLVWVQIVSQQNAPVNENLIQEALQNIGQDFRYSNVYRKTTYLPKNLKYILLWTDRDYAPLSFFEDGQRSFLKNNCTYFNCYVTPNRKFFGKDYTKFDAIAFNGRNMKVYDLPYRRSYHQKYIFFNMESSDNYPVCSARYDGFFNLTSTYKLDSDIPFPYILVRNKKGEIVGPKINMRWKEDMDPVGNEYTKKIENKTKAVAWFVSHCKTRSNREAFVKKLHNALYPYGYEVDVFGKCGRLKCARANQYNCELMLRRDYFFYLSLENSFAEDYVTEKLLTALEHNVIPVVLGGANYTRFLPPGSYIDGMKKNYYQLAAIMDRLSHNAYEYSQYFRWKKHYTFHDSLVENICNVCKALNNERLMKKTTIKQNFRSWWNPKFKDSCW